MNHLTDDVIISKVLQGNKDSFGLLVDRYRSYCYTIAYNVVKNDEEAEEIAQESFIKAYKSLAKFNQDSKFSTWLYRITFNTALTAQKKAAKYQKTEFDNRMHSPLDFQSNISEQKDQQKYVAKAMDQLLEADKVALTLFYFEEMSLEEICEVTGITLSTIKVRLHRARKRFALELQKLLKEEAINL
ncbi:RNA polymerase sigma factor [Fulvivirga lutea]|uniref:RNA polymerase sigma factor n=1 Tax=Fulvivirga lutea TaxID=2810512 RepID=A0A974WIR9_9BACT|nr:sigma-70 family RNA polymerase sigma factor [Fulvivirga lutea]QSE98940.1 sigma-70 family RNA polymerase sigma factor [Fulvivirga lutea]